MNNSRNTVIRQLLVSATTLAFISSSVHAESWSRSEDDPYMKYSVGNITIGGPLRRLTTEKLNQIVTSIRNIFEDVEVPEVPNPTDLATWRTEEFNNQHGLGLIGVEYRYIKGATGKNTLGVVYGSGIDLDHKDLGKIRADLNHSYGDDPTDLSDSSSGHGTFVYGVAGAARNDVGIHGVAPDAEFMILKRKPINTLVDFPDALKRAMNADADVMINSWAGVGLNQSHITPELEEQLNRIPQGDISIVFAAGNFKNPDPHYLARLPVEYPDLKGNWLAVTALGLNSDGSYKL